MLLVIALFARREKSRLLRGFGRGLGRRRGAGFLWLLVVFCKSEGESESEYLEEVGYWEIQTPLLRDHS